MPNRMLTDIPMPPLVIFGQSVNRKLLATQLQFTALDFGRNLLVIRVPIFHFITQTLEQTVEVDGETTVTQIETEQPYMDPRFTGRYGLIFHRLDVTDTYLVDVTTGRAPLPEVENPTLMGEFSYLRQVLTTFTLEDLLMFYLARLVEDGSFDNNRYPIEP